MATKIGRKRGGKNRGFFYRKGRGWYASLPGGGMTALCELNGSKIVDPADSEAAEIAYQRFNLARVDRPNGAGPAEPASRDKTTTVAEVCEAYLSHCQSDRSEATFTKRKGFLFDFCTGYPARFVDGQDRREQREPGRADKLHPGYGKRIVGDLIRADVTAWLAAHPGWLTSKYTAVACLLRCFNFAVSEGLISVNPIKGYKSNKGQARLTYITPEEEAAIYKYGRKHFALAVKICIRTGARYGCEFCKLTARHIEITDRGMLWKFSAAESKTRRPRTIMVRDPEIIEITKAAMERYPSGVLFRNQWGKPWSQPMLGSTFCRLKVKLAAKGIVMDNDACMYSTRHSFAKRTLNGFWTGKPCTIEVLAKLMGNTPEVARQYAAWCDGYTEPLWEAV